jgi:hypothetical protein
MSATQLGRFLERLNLYWDWREKMKDRKRQKANRKLKKREEALDRRNSYGAKDLTPFNAVLKIRTNGKSNIAV